MTQLVLTDREPLRAALAGSRIPRRAWAEVESLVQVLEEARVALAEARHNAQSIREQAFATGYAEGAAQAQAAAARHLAEAQQVARKFAQASQQRIVTLALGILTRIAPMLGQNEWVPALLTEALGAVTAQESLRVSVAPGAVAATEAVLAQWQRQHGRLEPVRVVADPALETFGCVVESELGRIEAGLSAQLAAVGTALHTVAAGTEA